MSGVSGPCRAFVPRRKLARSWHRVGFVAGCSPALVLSSGALRCPPPVARSGISRSGVVFSVALAWPVAARCSARRRMAFLFGVLSCRCVQSTTRGVRSRA
eukprot:11051214-Lingulodinium_polyedra.AAC.1